MAYTQKIKLKSGTAFRIFYSENGKRKSKYFPPGISAEELKKFAITKDFERAHSIAGLPLPEKVLYMQDLIDQYCESRKLEIDPWREVIAMKLFIREMENLPAHQITHKTIHQYRDKLYQSRIHQEDLTYEEDQKIRRGVNKELKILRTILRWAFKNDLISTNPFQKVSFFSEAENTPDVLTKEELELFFESLPKQGPSRLIFQIMRFTGLRRSAVLRLRYGDIDFETLTIRIYRTKNRKPMIKPLDPRLAEIMSAALPLGAPEYEPIFDIKPLSVTRNFKRAMTKAGINKKMPCHILRHTYGKSIIEHFLTSGDAERIAQEALGHKTRIMTKHYTQIVQNELAKALAQVDF